MTCTWLKQRLRTKEILRLTDVISRAQREVMLVYSLGSQPVICSYESAPKVGVTSFSSWQQQCVSFSRLAQRRKRGVSQSFSAEV